MSEDDEKLFKLSKASDFNLKKSSEKSEYVNGEQNLKANKLQSKRVDGLK
jgi:hypothetical protein